MRARTFTSRRGLLWKNLCLAAALPGLVLGTPPNSVVTNPTTAQGKTPPPPGKRGFWFFRPYPLTTSKERAGKNPFLKHERTPDEVLMDQGTIMDDYKKVMDEWGSIGMAPMLFSSADKESYDPEKTEGGTPVPSNLPKHPFKLRESPTAATSEFKLNFFYDQQGVSNGQILAAQRTQTKVAAEGNVNVDAVAAVVEGAKMEVLQKNLTNAQQGNAANKTLADEGLTTAQARFATAQADATAAQAAAAAAYDKKTAGSVAVIRTGAEVDKAERLKVTADAGVVSADGDLAEAVSRENAVRDMPQPNPTDVAAATALRVAAEQKLATAKTAAADADAGLRAAERLKTDADAQYKQAEGDFTKAEGLRTAANDELGQARTGLGEAQQAATNATYAPIAFPTSTEPKATTAGTIPATNPMSTVEKMMGDVSKVGQVGGAGEAGAKALLPASLGAGSGAAFAPMARINAAAAAMTVKNILTFLGDPGAAAAFEDKRVLFGVTSLSVNPGWRTRKDFKAVIDAEVKIHPVAAHDETIRQILNCPDYPVSLRKVIADQNEQALTEEHRQFFKGKKRMPPEQWGNHAKGKPGSLNVHVHAVSPMVDSQNLDLASSIARQDEVALYLAGTLSQMGMGASGNLFTSWAKLQRKDVATRSTVATANSFSTGDHFGFEIGTRLRGLDDADVKSHESTQILERQTFPVLLILGVRQDDARPRLEVSGGRILVWEPRLTTDYSTRWSRTGHDMLSWLGRRPERRPTDAYREVLDQGRLRSELDKEFQEMGNTGQMPDRGAYLTALADTYDSQQREFMSLAKAVHGQKYTQNLPAEWMLGNPPEPRELFDPDEEVDETSLKFEPTSLVFPRKETTRMLLIRGKGVEALDEQKISVVGGGLEIVPASVKRRSAGVLSVEVRPTGEHSGKAQFLLAYRELPGGGAMPQATRRESVTSPEIGFTVEDRALPEITRLEPGVTLEFDDAVTPPAGAEKEGLWKHLGATLVLKGTRLDLLSAAGATVKGAGIRAGAANVSVVSQGREAALVKFDVVSPTGAGELYLELTATTTGAGSTAPRVFSPAVKFSFPNAKPFLAPWKEDVMPKLVAATVSGEAPKKVSATVTVMLSGTALKQVKDVVVDVAGVFKGSAKVVTAAAKSLVVEATIEPVVPTTLQGPLILTFPQPDGPLMSVVSLRLEPPAAVPDKPAGNGKDKSP